MLRKISLLLSICFLLHQNIAYGEDNQQSIYEKRMALYKETEQSSGIPWYYLAKKYTERKKRYSEKTRCHHFPLFQTRNMGWTY